MKTSLKKLQKFAALRHDRRPQKRQQSMVLDELDRATQNMNDMRDCYDRLLSAAAATANSVYEFSESLREMGDCLLEKTALNDDEESGKVLLMLGKVQFELQKLVDGYRCHIFRTITIPSESLLNELRIVERDKQLKFISLKEMKKRCDGKREIYEDLLRKKKEKGRLRNCKGESFPSPPLEEARDEYDEEANVFVFRMKSLKQGQSRSFLTQASRHHAAQMYFFKKAVRSLEAIEPHVRLLAEKQHIDYQFNGLKDDGHGIYDDNESDGTDDSSDTYDDGELSFDYGQNDLVQDVYTLKSSMELDTTGTTFSPDPNAAKEILPSPDKNSFSFQRGFRAISKSAPLFPEKKLDSAERMSQLGPSPSRKFTSYVLPTPDETRSPVSRKLYNQTPETRQTDWNLHHSSPLDQKEYEKLGATDNFSGSIILDTQTVLKESNNTPKPNPLPSPFSETLSFKQLDPNVASYAKKAKRQAFSGPLTGNLSPNNPNVTASGPIFSSDFPIPYFGSLLRTPLPRPKSTPKLSSLASPTFVSSPKISELHELPRPPDNIVTGRTSNCGAHSGPLISKTNDMYSASISMTSTEASTLPAGGLLDVALRVPLEASQNSEKTEDISSPPLTPIALLNVQPACQSFK